MSDLSYWVWLRRILSTIVMMSVFFASFVGGISLFLGGDILRGAFSFFYIVIGLIISRLLWT